jgi:plasmid stabilization system protein ParE
MKKRKIKWDKPAIVYFRQAISYVRKDSPKNADKIKSEILAKIGELSYRPDIHAPDKYKRKSKGNYRAFELHRYRITYLVKDDEIIITSMRHTRQKPKKY